MAEILASNKTAFFEVDFLATPGIVGVPIVFKKFPVCIINFISIACRGTLVSAGLATIDVGNQSSATEYISAIPFGSLTNEMALFFNSEDLNDPELGQVGDTIQLSINVANITDGYLLFIINYNELTL